MTSSQVRQETIRLQRQWTPAERVARARLSRYRCARLIASLCAPDRESAEVWATGSMTADDLQRIAG